MKTLFLVDGAAGTGKTDLLEYLGRKFRAKGEVGIVRKMTTRAQRPDEKERNLHLDLEFVSEGTFNKAAKSAEFYEYEYGGERYGFSRQTLADALGKNRFAVIIVRDAARIRQIKRDFPEVEVVVVFVHTDRELVLKRLMQEDFSKDYVDLRLSRGVIAWEDYLKHPELYDRVLLNNGSKVDFERLVENLIVNAAAEVPDELVIDASERFRLPAPLVGHKEAIRRRLSRTDYDHNVFLMMKFRSGNKASFGFLRETLEDRGYNCVRADQRQWNITKDVYNPLAVLFCCRYGIALFDEPEDGAFYNPNVAYELGVMHLLRKECLILRHDGLPFPPFDLISRLHKTYGRDIEMREAVFRWLDEISHDK